MRLGSMIEEASANGGKPRHVGQRGGSPVTGALKRLKSSITNCEGFQTAVPEAYAHAAQVRLP